MTDTNLEMAKHYPEDEWLLYTTKKEKGVIIVSMILGMILGVVIGAGGVLLYEVIKGIL